MATAGDQKGLASVHSPGWRSKGGFSSAYWAAQCVPCVLAARRKCRMNWNTSCLSTSLAAQCTPCVLAARRGCRNDWNGI
eukprot:scaffold139866_cov19-Tisochrysis_lutea.AAC.3